MIHNFTNLLFPEQISHSLTVDLEKNFSRFSFLEHHPEKKGEIDHIFNMATRSISGEEFSVSKLLEAQELDPDHLDMFHRLGFKQLSSHPEIGIILEHPRLPGWLIKKNYGFQKSDACSKRILKVVEGSNFPLWMLPAHLRSSTENSISIQVPNDIIHPLRVVMLKRGRKLTKQLELYHVRAAKEFLCLLPSANPNKFLYKRSVVLSQKESVLSTSDNTHFYAQLANTNPNKLTEIANQIALFIQHLRLTDSHLNNFPFLDDGTDTVLALDGEPIGGLADSSQPGMVEAIQTFDPSFYSLLGLKKLQGSIYDQLKEEGVLDKDIIKVQSIFDKVINSTIKNVVNERAWQLFQTHVNTSSFMLTASAAFIHTFFAFFYKERQLALKNEEESRQ